MHKNKKILSFGSLNIDTVFSVDHIVAPGETLSSNKIQTFVGGKGLNQSIALSRSHGNVYHAGAVGEDDGKPLLEALQKVNINTENIKVKDGKSGNAIIQIDKNGQNSILLSDGANKQITVEEIYRVFEQFDAGDIVVLQNEINLLNKIIDIAHEKDMIIFLNPSPLNEYIFEANLEKIDWFILNEIEAAQLIKQEKYTDTTKDLLIQKYPNAEFVITLGEKGSLCYSKGEFYYQDIYKVDTVDTTGAGDTFTGYFISAITENKPIAKALNTASAASALSVSREGASSSIPTKQEVDNFLKKKSIKI